VTIGIRFGFTAPPMQDELYICQTSEVLQYQALRISYVRGEDGRTRDSRASNRVLELVMGGMEMMGMEV